jgi:hypothetical protein
VLDARAFPLLGLGDVLAQRPELARLGRRGRAAGSVVLELVRALAACLGAEAARREGIWVHMGSLAIAREVRRPAIADMLKAAGASE